MAWSAWISIAIVMALGARWRSRERFVPELRRAGLAFVVLTLMMLVGGWLIYEQFSNETELLGLALGISASASLGFPFASSLARKLLKSEGVERRRGRQLLAALASTALCLTFLAAGAFLTVYYLNEHYLTALGA